MQTDQRVFAILYAVGRIGSPTPAQLSRCLFESGLLEPFDLYAELSTLVERGRLKQAISADGLVYQTTEASAEMLQGDGGLGVEGLAEMDRCLDALRAQFEAEKDYIAQYTESSTGVVPVFLSIRKGPRILLKVNLIVPDVETARVVTRNWMKNAHQAHRAVWESIGEGRPFPEFGAK